MKALLFAAAVVLAAPTLSAQTAPQTPMDPVGSYNFQVMLPDGNAIGGRFAIRGEKDKWEGTITSDVAPETPISSIRVDGQVLAFSIVAPDGTALPLRLTFTGDDFSGELSFQGTTLIISGKRQRAQ